MPERFLMLSVRPEYSRAIFAGTKTVELRRVRPGVSEGDMILLYETAPTSKLVGEFTVGTVLSGSPRAIWNRVGDQSGLSRTEFRAYYAGAEEAFAILVAKPRHYRPPVSFAELRRRHSGFRPPQSYWYPSEREYRSLRQAVRRVTP